jgi:hypothetical protein
MTPFRVSSLLMWFGLLVPPAAWTLQHVTGFFLTQATCLPHGRTWTIHMDAWTAAVGAFAVLLIVAGIVASVVAFRRTSGAESGTPDARVHFMSIMAMCVGPLVLFIVVMSTLGATLLTECQQS